MISIWGYDLLGLEKKEGIRYAWQDDRFRNYVESAAFLNRTATGLHLLKVRTWLLTAG